MMAQISISSRRAWLLVMAIMMMQVSDSLAQQSPSFAYYMSTPLQSNPAFAGSRDVLSFTGISRFQWVGLEGAPRSYLMVFDTPINRYRLGLGGTILSDRIGPDQFFQASADLSYRVSLTNKWGLYFGLKMGLQQRTSSLSSLATVDVDPYFSNSNINKFRFYSGAGALLRSKSFFLGLGLPRLIHTSAYSTNLENTPESNRRTSYLIGGYSFERYSKFKIYPTAQINVVQSYPLQMNFSVRTLTYDKIWLGAGYRSGNVGALLAGIQFSEQLNINYAYERAFGALNGFYFGAHEISITFDFNFKPRKTYSSPRML